MELADIYKWHSTSPVHLKLLYRLLSQREPHQNISHTVMPSWEDHVNFVNSRPYAKWYIIVVDDLGVGSIYLTRGSEIGLFIDRKYRGCGFGAIALNKLIQDTHERPLYANISPHNYGSVKFFKRHGFKAHSETKDAHGKVIQDTYIYDVSRDEFYSP